MFHRVGGTWQNALSDQGIVDSPNLSAIIDAVSFTDDGFGLVVGGAAPLTQFVPYTPYILSYRGDGRWYYETTPDIQSTLQSVSQTDAQHALAVGTNGVILSYGYGPGSPVPTPTPAGTPAPDQTPLPSERILDPRNPLLTYFPRPIASA